MNANVIVIDTYLSNNESTESDDVILIENNSPSKKIMDKKIIREKIIKESKLMTMTTRQNRSNKNVSQPEEPNVLDNCVIISAFNIDVEKKDLMRLKGDWKFNDVLIDFYLSMITYKLKTYCLAISSYCFRSFTSKNLNKSKNWTQKRNLFSFGKVFIPITYEDHWTVVIISINEKTIEHYDSSQASDRSFRKTKLYFDFIKDFLLFEAKANSVIFNIKEWKFGSIKNIPQQLNDFDCGAFLCAIVKKIAENDLNFLDQKEMAQFKNEIYDQMIGFDLELNPKENVIMTNLL
jgi:Ulp1 family protease